MNLRLTVNAKDDGGSCQLSLSYNQGKSFRVIHTHIGGCPAFDEWGLTLIFRLIHLLDWQYSHGVVSLSPYLPWWIF